MDKFLSLLGIIFALPNIALAHGEEAASEVGFIDQLKELSPFEHLGERHWAAFIVSLILWLSFLYVIYLKIKPVKR